MTPAAAITKATALRAAILDAAAEVLVATARHDVVKGEMDAWDAQWLAANEVLNEYEGTRIVKPDDSWMMGDEDSARFFQARNEHIAANYDVPGWDYCPACMADSARIEAENAMLDAAGAVIPELHSSRVRRLELRAKAIDLLLGLACAREIAA